jgi:hypothetical protein
MDNSEEHGGAAPKQSARERLQANLAGNQTAATLESIKRAQDALAGSLAGSIPGELRRSMSALDTPNSMALAQAQAAVASFKSPPIQEDEELGALRRLVLKVIAEAVRRARGGPQSFVSWSQIASYIGVSESTLRVWQQPDDANKGKGTLRSYDLAAVVRLFRLANMSMDHAFESILQVPDRAPALERELETVRIELDSVKKDLRRYQLVVDALLEKPKSGENV